jgi:hypothetical protein
MIHAGDVRFQGIVGSDLFVHQRATISNLDATPTTVGFNNRMYHPPSSYTTEVAGLYLRTDHSVGQLVYGIYGEVDALQSQTGGSFLKVLHKGLGDACYVGMLGNGNSGYGYEAAMFGGTQTTGGSIGADKQENGFLASFQGSGGFSASRKQQSNTVGFHALVHDDATNPTTPDLWATNYGLFYANNSLANAFRVRVSSYANTGNAQIALSDSSLRNLFVVYGTGETHLIGAEALVGSQNQPSPEFHLRGRYWNSGTPASRDVIVKNVLAAGASQEYHYYGDPASPTLGWIGLSTGIDLQAHALTQAASITLSAGGLSYVDFQNGYASNISQLLGYSGGLIIVGDQASGGSLNLRSTSHATKGKITLGASATSAYDEVNDRLGLGTNAPTHTLTLAAAKNAAFYNTADQTTNYERVAFDWTSNQFLIDITKGGSGTQRDMKIRRGGLDFITLGSSVITISQSMATNGIVTGATFSHLFDSGNNQVKYGNNAGVARGHVIGMGATCKNWILSNWDSWIADHGHADQTNPTMYWHSATATSTSTAQWGSVTHNQTDLVFSTGLGKIKLSPIAGSPVEVSNNLSVIGQWYPGSVTTNTPTGSTQTISFNNGNFQVLALGSTSGTVTLTLTNPQTGANYIIKTIQHATVPVAVTWPATVKWKGGVAPVISVGASAVDIIELYWDGTNYFGTFNQAYA